jgi:hypothetical protein
MFNFIHLHFLTKKQTSPQQQNKTKLLTITPLLPPIQTPNQTTPWMSNTKSANVMLGTRICRFGYRFQHRCSFIVVRESRGEGIGGIEWWWWFVFGRESFLA